MSYEFDLFVSYRRSQTVGQWVNGHLLPRLQARLDDIAGHQIKVSHDSQLDAGGAWPQDLKRRLVRSKLLLAVWSADYFRSDWCMAEWRSFKEREAALGMFTDGNPAGLVYPIRYADGDNFHPDAKQTQCTKDFSRLNYPDPAFRESSRYLDFDDLVRSLAEDLLRRLSHVPPWSPDFPVVEPAPMVPVILERPVL